MGEAIQKRLVIANRSGLLAFSTEALLPSGEDADLTDSLGYRLEASGRYCHDVTYVRRLACSLGLKFVSERQVHLRYDDENPVIGLLHFFLGRWHCFPAYRLMMVSPESYQLT